MSDLLIALLPPVPEQSWPRREIAAELAAYNYNVKILEELASQPINGDLDLAGAWVAHCALELAARSNRAPVLLVAYGAAGRMLAALGSPSGPRAPGRRVRTRGRRGGCPSPVCRTGRTRRSPTWGRMSRTSRNCAGGTSCQGTTSRAKSGRSRTAGCEQQRSAGAGDQLPLDLWIDSGHGRPRRRVQSGSSFCSHFHVSATVSRSGRSENPNS